jgi:hypothetical protein
MRRMSRTVHVPCRPSLDLGRIVGTPGALAATANGQRLRYLARHSIGDWGRILRPIGLTPPKPRSGFGANTLWIVTEGAKPWSRQADQASARVREKSKLLRFRKRTIGGAAFA